jgi:uncharacterized membrane protein YfcA|tara:strand:+ start:408 stop:1163 length:756 start_codon:yes stop_codon:yes gene_type:complete
LIALVYEALNFDGLVWILTAAFLAGIVRGFTGFGTALVFIPLVAQVLTPIEAVFAMVIFDFIGVLPTVPRALKDGKVPDVLRLGAGMILTTPLGLLALYLMSQSSFRLLASLMILILLTLLIFGIRYRGELTNRLIYITGALGGLLGGSAGMPGPPVILIYMASRSAPSIIRANLLLYAMIGDTVIFLLCLLSFNIAPLIFLFGIIAIIPFVVGVGLGSKVFNPKKEGAYRVVAYIVIGFSAIYGLPFWGF